MFGGTKPSSSFSFGSATATTSAPSLFGTTTTTTPKPLFGAGTQQHSTPSLFGSSQATQPTTNLFGSASTNTAAPFGSTTGSLFGKPATTGFGTTTLGGFGAQKPGGLFGTPATSNTQATAPAAGRNLQQLIQESDGLVRSVTNVELYGDERDNTVARLNQLAAAIGVGSGQYKRDQQPAKYHDQCPFFRFKTIGYNASSTHTEDDGLVSLIVKAPHTQFATSQQNQAFLDGLFAILENKTDLKPRIFRVHPLPDNNTKVVVYVIQNNTGRVKASQLSAFFNQPNKKQLLESNLKVDKERIAPVLAMDYQQKRLFLKEAPPGIDSVLWQQAAKENPDPSKLTPYPIRGFEQLRDRQKTQTHEMEVQNRGLDRMRDRCCALETALASATSRKNAHRAVQKQLSHRLLRILAMQMVTQRFAHGVDETEEEMKAALEIVNAKLNSPNQIKHNISELFALLRSESDKLRARAAAPRSLAEGDVVQLKKYLSRCQDGLENLVNIVNRNLDDLKVMTRMIS